MKKINKNPKISLRKLGIEMKTVDNISVNKDKQGVVLMRVVSITCTYKEASIAKKGVF